MRLRHALSDEQWDKIKDALPGKVGDRGRTAEDNRLFIDAVMWIAKTGSPWRALPDYYGKWSTVHKRFMRWSTNGVWQMISNTLAAEADTEWRMVENTILRAQQQVACAKRAAVTELRFSSQDTTGS